MQKSRDKNVRISLEILEKYNTCEHIHVCLHMNILQKVCSQEPRAV